MQVHIQPTMAMPLLLASSEPPSQTLAQRAGSKHSLYLLLELPGTEERTPKPSAFSLEVRYPCTRSSECGGGGFLATITLSPPSAFLLSGPKPGATSKCRLIFLEAPGTAVSHLF